MTIRLLDFFKDKTFASKFVCFPVSYSDKVLTYHSFALNNFTELCDEVSYHDFSDMSTFFFTSSNVTQNYFITKVRPNIN